MSDTPRMHSALMDAPDAGFAIVWRVGCDIERELNTAQERIKRLEECLIEAKNQYAVLVADVVLYEDRGDRIKRLEEAGDGLLTAMRDDRSEYVDWIDETTDAISKWNKAKEAKP